MGYSCKEMLVEPVVQSVRLRDSSCAYETMMWAIYCCHDLPHFSSSFVLSYFLPEDASARWKEEKKKVSISL